MLWKLLNLYVLMIILWRGLDNRPMSVFEEALTVIAGIGIIVILTAGIVM